MKYCDTNIYLPYIVSRCTNTQYFNHCMEAPCLFRGVQRVAYHRRVRSSTRDSLNLIFRATLSLQVELRSFYHEFPSYMWVHLRAFKGHSSHNWDPIFPLFGLFLEYLEISAYLSFSGPLFAAQCWFFLISFLVQHVFLFRTFVSHFLLSQLILLV